MEKFIIIILEHDDKSSLNFATIIGDKDRENKAFEIYVAVGQTP